MRVQITDKGNPPRSSVNLLVFNILRNQNRPVFEGNNLNYRESILETYDVGVELVTVTAIDRDEEVAIFFYLFILNRFIGIVMISIIHVWRKNVFFLFFFWLDIIIFKFQT